MNIESGLLGEVAGRKNPVQYILTGLSLHFRITFKSLCR